MSFEASFGWGSTGPVLAAESLFQSRANRGNSDPWGFRRSLTVSLCAEHVQQLGSESLLSDLMEVKD